MNRARSVILGEVVFITLYTLTLYTLTLYTLYTYTIYTINYTLYTLTLHTHTHIHTYTHTHIHIHLGEVVFIKTDTLARRTGLHTRITAAITKLQDYSLTAVDLNAWEVSSFLNECGHEVEELKKSVEDTVAAQVTIYYMYICIYVYMY
jgi:hypothetical protein